MIIPPNEDDPDSPLHPSQMVDRPHIIRNTRTGQFVCWLKIMGADEAQRSTVLVADRITGPYAIVRTGLRPLDMSAGDFDLVVDPDDGKAYYFFERVHSDLICADLDDDYTDVTGSYTTHFPRGCPPFVREAPAHFVRGGVHYLVTSGTTGYHPNPSEIASASSYHGPWTVLGDPHPTDASRTSFNSQISSVFRHPAKRDLYIAVADRWMPDLPEQAGDYFATGEASAVATADHGASVRRRGRAPRPEQPARRERRSDAALRPLARSVRGRHLGVDGTCGSRSASTATCRPSSGATNGRSTSSTDEVGPPMPPLERIARLRPALR